MGDMVEDQGRDVNIDIPTWVLPEGAIVRLGRGRVRDLAFSPDGKTLAVGSYIGVWLYDMSTMSPFTLLDTARGVVFAVAFSPNGDFLATGNWDGEVKVWNMQSRCCISKMRRGGHFDAASQLAFSPDGKRLISSGGRYDAIYVWHPETGERIAEFAVENAPKRGGRPYIIPLAFSPDGNLIAAATPENTVSLWDIETGERSTCLHGHTAMVTAIAFSPCGSFVTSGDSKGTLREWHIHMARQTREFTEYGQYCVIPTYFSEGSLMAAGVYETSIAVWDVENNEKLDTFEYCGSVDAAHFSNGTHLAVANSRDFKVWRKSIPNISTISGHTSYPCSLTFSPDGATLAVVEGGGTTACWEVNSKHRHPVNCGEKTLVHSVYIASTGDMQVLGRKGNTLTAWSVEADQTIAAFSEGCEYTGPASAFSSTGKLWASTVEGKKICIWDSHGKETVLAGHTDFIESITFSPDENRLASVARDATARVWNVESGEEIISLALSPPLHLDSLPATAPLNTDVYKGEAHEIQALLNGEKPRTRNTEIKVITFSSCGSFLASGMAGGIRLWDATTYETRMVILLPRDCHRQFALVFSPCGQYLASGAWWWNTEKVSIRLWDVLTGENIATFWGHPTDVQDLAFSPDGTLLASASFDGTILLWDMTPYLQNETP